jgi:Ca2+-binding RTX toxin-like protein
MAGGLGADLLLGEDDNDVLNGRAGADTLRGGDGWDTYLVSDTVALVVELDGQGIDEIIAETDYLLPDHVERLRLIDAADLAGTGNALANRLVGNDGANLLLGMGGADRLVGGLGADTLDGGAGRDQLAGGSGADAFLLAAPAEAGDTLLEFTPGEDVLRLLGAGFGGLPAGSLDGALTPGGVARFIVAADRRSTAEAGEWQFVFDDARGTLFLDTNGIAGGHRSLVAALPGVTLTAADIVIG